jgi:nucleotide-binding universal stress UspA family protein
MRKVLAALDASAAARPVIETACGVGQLVDAEVEALHVGDRRVETLDALATQYEVTLRVIESRDVTARVLDAVEAPEVVAAVVGARATPGGRRPTGRTALSVVEGTRKPTIVVPPDTVSSRPLKRLLIPLEGSEHSSRAVIEGLLPLIVDEVELVVLHVFTPDTVPRVLDHPQRDLELIGSEFLARYCPHATRIDWRTGRVAPQVCSVCSEEAADLIVLSWSQDNTPGHAAVIRDVLGDARHPVLLLPIPQQDTVSGPG